MDNFSENDFMSHLNTQMRKIEEGEIVSGKVYSIRDDLIIVDFGYMKDGIINKQDALYDLELNLKDQFKPGDEIQCMIMKLNDGEGNVILSKKEADSIKLWENLEKYKNSKRIMDIEVKEVVKGGLVTYLDGYRAFIPQSQLGEKRDLNSYVGKTISVNVLEFNKEDKKIILSRKEIEINEREKRVKNAVSYFFTSHKPGDIFEGIVIKLLPFGALVEIEKDVVGLVHISEISEKNIPKVSDVLSVYDKVKVKILSLDEDSKKISLTIKGAEETPKEDFKHLVDNNGISQNLGDIFKDKFKNFKFDKE